MRAHRRSDKASRPSRTQASNATIRAFEDAEARDSSRIRSQQALHRLRLTDQLEAGRFEAFAARCDVDARRPTLGLECVDPLTDHPNQVRARDCKCLSSSISRRLASRTTSETDDGTVFPDCRVLRVQRPHDLIVARNTRRGEFPGGRIPGAASRFMGRIERWIKPGLSNPYHFSAVIDGSRFKEMLSAHPPIPPPP